MGGEGQVICYTPTQITLCDPNTLTPVLNWGTRGREVVGGGRGLAWWDSRIGGGTAGGGQVIRRVGGVNIRGPALAFHPSSAKTVGVVRGLREGVWGLDYAPARPHQGPRIALSSGSCLYLLDVLK
ncbi:hypothetical protein Pmani_018620 [Petrolisthes manimaculis]|uniref:Uncharacterized protein n=1 Tax=Petrolisthes manimaculis TaxID=1843537 RepID=A0AAE1PKN7_9EUCA|nr:hypothetical protein Pmani_018620 [Petrolisthes manimaculis]